MQGRKRIRSKSMIPYRIVSYRIVSKELKSNGIGTGNEFDSKPFSPSHQHEAGWANSPERVRGLSLCVVLL